MCGDLKLMDSAQKSPVRFERGRKSYDGQVQFVRDLDLTVRKGNF